VSIRFIHTADWQLGRQFGQIQGDPGAYVRGQRPKTVQNIGKIASEKMVDAVLVAGDIFESNAVSDETLYKFLDAVRTFTGPWIFLPGNHDPAVPGSVWARLEGMNCPSNLLFSRTAEPIMIANERLAILPAPLRRRHEVSDLTEDWSKVITPMSAVRVGLAHGSVENRLPGKAQSTNPISDTRASEARMDYIALGDWHGTLEIAHKTWYAGTPEPDRFRNNDAGNILLVSIGVPGAEATVEKIVTKHYEWSELRYSIFGPDDLIAVESGLAALTQPYDRNLVSLTLTGAVDLGTQSAIDDLLAQWKSRFLWIVDHCEDLVAQPTQADLDRIDAAGFVRAAIDQLQTLQNNPSNQDAALANTALHILYQTYVAGSAE
jgi:hypothetical protein